MNGSGRFLSDCLIQALTLGCGILFLVFVVGANNLIGRGPDRNYFLLAAYLGLGVLSVIAAGVYLKRRNVDLAEAGVTWLFVLAISGGALVLAWPLLLPILLWNETVLTQILRKHYFHTDGSDTDVTSPVDRPLSDEEKIAAMRELARRSQR